MTKSIFYAAEKVIKIFKHPKSHFQNKTPKLNKETPPNNWNHYFCKFLVGCLVYEKRRKDSILPIKINTTEVILFGY